MAIIAKQVSSYVYFRSVHRLVSKQGVALLNLQ